ncbi:MAG: Gx transporter family protein [Oscillospiraceae bacterium]|nr:Gx transporter family protein [Oscillospiraceae bacterium]
MKTRAKYIAFLGVFLAFSVALGYFERALPPIAPAFPGIKLGLPNMAVIALMYMKDYRTAFLLNICRVIISGILFSGMLGMFYGLFGACVSFAAMALLKKTNAFGIVGVSSAGGVFHNLGQICAGALIVGGELFYYFPALTIFGTVSGAAIGYLSGLVINRLNKLGFGANFMNHYFESNEHLNHRPNQREYTHKFTKFEFVTDAGVFSKNGVDRATDILLCSLPELSGKVLDLGCGFGCVGIVIAKIYKKEVEVTMSDVNGRAVELAETNAEKNGIKANTIKSDAFENIPGKFGSIITNPPIHAGKDVVYRLYAEAHGHLDPNGRFFAVIQKKHGALTHRQKLSEIFGERNCRAIYSKKGYFVFECTK